MHGSVCSYQLGEAPLLPNLFAASTLAALLSLAAPEVLESCATADVSASVSLLLRF